MKFLKQKNISRWSVSDNTFITNQYGRAVMDLDGALRLPKGGTGRRPNTSGVRLPEGANGYIRYNTDTDSIEAYIAGAWQVVTAPATSAITKQTLGPGDYVTTIFGPLTQVPSQDEAILVYVENVFQINVTNYDILYNYLGSGNAHIQFTSPVPQDKLITIYFGFAN
jgi:hypothetical protein